MKQDSGHITRKVAIGYVLLIIIALCSVTYIYHVIVELAATDETDTSVPRQKIYLITGALARLYESETLGQLIGSEGKEYTHYNRLLNVAQQDIDSLRALVTDPVQRTKIDTIDRLIERKRLNTKRLLETLKQANSERLYKDNIDKIIAIQDTAVDDVKLEEQVEIRQDTVLVGKKPKGFFRRLAEVFVPARQDSGVVINSTRHYRTDTLMQAYNPADTIVSVLKSIQDSVADQRKELQRQLQVRASTLRYDNGLITGRINQILRDIEREEVDASLGRVREKQQLLNQTSRLIAAVAVVSLLIAVVFLFFIGRDLSRSQYYRRQLEKAKQYAEDLLHVREKLMLTISHDIRAPLSSILGYVDLMERLAPGERAAYYLKNMTGSAEHILALVNDLLDFHRLESNQMEIHPVPFRVYALFTEIYESFRPLAEKKGLAFDFEWQTEAGEPVCCLGDTIRLRQIAGNLLSNAVKFTPEGKVALQGCIREEASGTARLSFCVIDAGPGIPPDQQEKIFGEFTRLSTAEKEEGFGLGLSITRKLIELMDGSLTLASLPGKGSRFTVTIPLPVAACSENTGENRDLPDGKRRPAAGVYETDRISAERPAGTAGGPVVCKPEEMPGSIKTVGTGRENNPDTEPEKKERPSGRRAMLPPVTCLIVDDDSFQLTVTQEILSVSGIRAVCCDRPREAARLSERIDPDLVITDIQMPGFDGFAVLKSIRESGVPGVAALPVVALSASVANEKEHYLAAGFTGFLNKPFSPATLISLVEELTGAEHAGPVAGNWNFTSLTAFAGDDTEASARILDTFRKETRKSIDSFREALVASDREKAGRIAHKLIPLFTMLEAVDVAVLLRKLEENASGLTRKDWQELLARTVSAVMQVVESVECRLGNNSPAGENSPGSDSIDP